jgi:hypothetical protein
MRSRSGRWLLHLAVLAVVAALTLIPRPAQGKGGFCPGLCGESLSLNGTFESVTFE